MGWVKHNDIQNQRYTTGCRVTKISAKIMLNRLIRDAGHIYLCTGVTDFRKGISGLVALVSMQFKLDPFAPTTVFLFCNRRRTSIKVLLYDKNGFILATKTLLDGMKFQWPKNQNEVKSLDPKQVEWLLDGLCIVQKTALKPLDRTMKNSCF